MPRPQCPRRIAHTPLASYYKPAGIPLRMLRETVLAADEMETLRLADAKGLYNKDAAVQMGISRQTFERILNRARKKVSTALVEGLAIRIDAPLRPDSPLPAGTTPSEGLAAKPTPDTKS